MTDDLLNAHGCRCEGCAGVRGAEEDAAGIGREEAVRRSEGRFRAAQDRLRGEGRTDEGLRARRRAK